MPDRLTELQHQRALLQEHLAWIEGEIAAEAARRGWGPAGQSAGAPEARPTPAPVQWSVQGDGPVPVAETRIDDDSDAESILEQYREESQDTPQNVRKGCILYFALALVLLGAAMAALYFYTIGRR
jgi:hypothetical protein